MNPRIKMKEISCSFSCFVSIFRPTELYFFWSFFSYLFGSVLGTIILSQRGDGRQKHLENRIVIDRITNYIITKKQKRKIVLNTFSRANSKQMGEIENDLSNVFCFVCLFVWERNENEFDQTWNSNWLEK